MTRPDDKPDGKSEAIPDRPGAPRLTPEEIAREVAGRERRKPVPDPDDALSDKRGEG